MKKYGLLDPMPLNNKEDIAPLKCECCGLLFDDEENYNSIDETGECLDCYKEFND